MADLSPKKIIYILEKNLTDVKAGFILLVTFTNVNVVWLTIDVILSHLFHRKLSTLTRRVLTIKRQEGRGRLIWQYYQYIT